MYWDINKLIRYFVCILISQFIGNSNVLNSQHLTLSFEGCVAGLFSEYFDWIFEDCDVNTMGAGIDMLLTFRSRLSNWRAFWDSRKYFRATSFLSFLTASKSAMRSSMEHSFDNQNNHHLLSALRYDMKDHPIFLGYSDRSSYHRFNTY